MNKIDKVDDYNIAGIDLALEGKFQHILKVLYQIEHQDRVGSVAYLEMERDKVKVRDRKKEVLLATVKINRLLNE